MRHSKLAWISAAIVLAASPSRAGGFPSCGWINSIQSWNGSYGWSWSHHDSWAQLPDLFSQATVQDGGGGSFELDGFIGTFNGDIEGSLGFDDDYQVEDEGDVLSHVHTALSGPIVGPFPGMAAQMLLQLDDFDCTYWWSAGAWGNGTHTTLAGSEAVTTQPNAIWSGKHPIPELPGPLSFSGPARVTLNPTVPSDELQFTPYGDGATVSLNRQNAPTPAPAQVDWIFRPGDATTPFNDACAGATFLIGGDAQDTSFATTDASDPAASCGAGDRSVWFTFFAPETGIAEVSTAGSGYGTIVSVWPVSESCGALATEVACGGNGASVPVQENTAYRVQVRRNGSAGNGALQVSVSVPEPGAGGATLVAIAALARIRRAHAASSVRQPSATARRPRPSSPWLRPSPAPACSRPRDGADPGSA